MNSTKSRPWKMVLPLAAIVGLWVLWSIYWFVAQSFAHQEFDRQRQKFSEKGSLLSCSGEGWGGYPFRFEFACAELRLETITRVRIDASRLQAVALAYKPWQAVALLDGPTTIDLPRLPAFTAKHDRALASLTVTSAKGGTVTAEVNNFDAENLAKANRIVVSVKTEDQRQYDTALDGTAITLRTEIGTAIVIDQLAVRGTLTADQVFVLQSAEAKQGGLTLTAAGQLALDPNRNITGQIIVKANNATKAIAMIGDALKLPEQARNALAALLQLSGNQITFTAGNGQLFAGPIKIAELKPL